MQQNSDYDIYRQNARKKRIGFRWSLQHTQLKVRCLKNDDSLMRISNPAIAEELLEFEVLQS